jgi:putative membrane protein
MAVSVVAALHPISNLGIQGFSIHPSTVIGIAALGALYLWRTRAARLSGDELPTRKQHLYFFSGLIAMFLSLNGPIHDLSDEYLFSAHMVQHLLLTLLVPPLLLAGTTGSLFRPALRYRPIRALAKVVTRPFACFAIFNLAIIIWHLPFFYNAAMADHNIHILEHMVFMVTAVLMWWPFLSPLPELPRLAYPGQMLYCFLMSIPMSVVAAYISLAEHLLYPAYATAARVLPLTPLQDQQLGGLIMWVPGGIIFYVIMTVVFFKWVARGEDHTAGAQVNWTPKSPTIPAR